MTVRLIKEESAGCIEKATSFKKQLPVPPIQAPMGVKCMKLQFNLIVLHCMALQCILGIKLFSSVLPCSEKSQVERI